MELEPKLATNKVVPMFTLPDKHGTEQNLAKQRGRDHLLLMFFRGDLQPQAYVRDLAQQAASWRQIPARGIVVTTSEDAAGALGSVPFTVLIDQDQRIFDRFLPADAQAGVFVMDRYAALYHQWLATDVKHLPSAEDIEGWLQAISMQCVI